MVATTDSDADNSNAWYAFLCWSTGEADIDWSYAFSTDIVFSRSIEFILARRRVMGTAFGKARMPKTFRGKSTALGHGGRAAKLKSEGVPGGVIGEIARRKGAAPGGPNFHPSKRGK